jgi:hypothetical protein
MKKIIFSILITLAFILLTPYSFFSQTQRVKLTPNKPSAYIKFERIGKGEPLEIDEGNERIWLRLINNTKWTVTLFEFDMIEGNAGKGLYYEIEREIDNGLPKEVPIGYRRTGDAFSPAALLKSGKSILFSVPREHLVENLTIRIDFNFIWERNKEKAYSTESEPRHSIYFSASDLNNSLRVKSTLQ